MGPDTLLEGAAELVDAELPNTERVSASGCRPQESIGRHVGSAKTEHR